MRSLVIEYYSLIIRRRVKVCASLDETTPYQQNCCFEDMTIWFQDNNQTKCADKYGLIWDYPYFHAGEELTRTRKLVRKCEALLLSMQSCGQIGLRMAKILIKVPFLVNCPFIIDCWRSGPFKLDFHEIVNLSPNFGKVFLPTANLLKVTSW